MSDGGLQPEPEDPGTADAEAVSRDEESPHDQPDPGIVRRFFGGLMALVLWPFLAVASKIPRTSAIGDRMIRSGYRLKYKLSNADVLLNVIYDDDVVIPKAAYLDTDEGEYRTKDGHTATTDGEGHHPYLMDQSVPVQWTLAHNSETLSPVQAYIAHQRERGRYVQRETEDGDTEVYVAADVPDDADSVVLDFEKAWEMYWQQVDSEDLEEQYDLGYQAGLEGPKRLWLYVLGAFVGGMLAVVALLFVATRFLTGGGGGGTIIGLLAPLGVV
jgi:hypothetical protein